MPCGVLNPRNHKTFTPKNLHYACDRRPRMASCSSAGRSFSGNNSSFSSSASRAACAGLR